MNSKRKIGTILLIIAIILAIIAIGIILFGGDLGISSKNINSKGSGGIPAGNINLFIEPNNSTGGANGIR